MLNCNRHRTRYQVPTADSVTVKARSCCLDVLRSPDVAWNAVGDWVAAAYRQAGRDSQACVTDETLQAALVEILLLGTSPQDHAALLGLCDRHTVTAPACGAHCTHCLQAANPVVLTGRLEARPSAQLRGHASVQRPVGHMTTRSGAHHTAVNMKHAPLTLQPQAAAALTPQTAAVCH